MGFKGTIIVCIQTRLNWVFIVFFSIYILIFKFHCNTHKNNGLREAKNLNVITYAGPLNSALTRMTLSRGTLDILLTEQRDGIETTILFQTLHKILIT